MKKLLFSLLLACGLVSAAPNKPPINSIPTIISDMALKNDAVLAGYENRTSGWYVGPGYVVMGNEPLSTNTPAWYKSRWNGLPQQEAKAILPWVVIFDGVGNKATNTRIQIKNISISMLVCSTKQWVVVSEKSIPSGYDYDKATLYSFYIPGDERLSKDGTALDIKPALGTGYTWHGWGNMNRIPVPRTEICGWLTTMKARLVVDNPANPDDRVAAQYLIHVGADYYPDLGTSWFVSGYNPGVGVSRAKLVKNEWQAFNMITLTDVGIQDVPVVRGITSKELVIYPPPLE